MDHERHPLLVVLAFLAWWAWMAVLAGVMGYGVYFAATTLL